MIHIIEDTYDKALKYFAINTLSLTGGTWKDTPKDALNFFTNGIDVRTNHSTAEDVAKGLALWPSQRIYSSYSPEEYPELFI
jgi:hypothetical protein